MKWPFKARIEARHYPHLRPAFYREQRRRAKRLRANPTRAEATLWYCIQRMQLGHRFRRQQVIGPHIVDFYCDDLGLIVEVDGPYHEQPDAADSDARRDRELRSMGFCVLRLANHTVLHRPEIALARLERAMAEGGGRAEGRAK